jgi:hypothetical protein
MLMDLRRRSKKPITPPATLQPARECRPILFIPAMSPPGEASRFEHEGHEAHETANAGNLRALRVLRVPIPFNLNHLTRCKLVPPLDFI